jgi:hypothetical protein
VPVLTKAGQQIVERLLVTNLLQSNNVNVVIEDRRDEDAELGLIVRPSSQRELAGGEQVLNVPTRNRDHDHSSARPTVQPGGAPAMCRIEPVDTPEPSPCIMRLLRWAISKCQAGGLARLMCRRRDGSGTGQAGLPTR